MREVCRAETVTDRETLFTILTTELYHLNGQRCHRFEIPLDEIVLNHAIKDTDGFITQFYTGDNYTERSGFFNERGGRRVFLGDRHFVYAEVFLSGSKLHVNLKQQKYEGNLSVN